MVSKSALEVFPTLRRYAFYPRLPTKQFPIGLKPPRSFYETREPHEDSEQVAHSPQVVTLRTIYHDLGAVAFGGCTTEHVNTIGSILEKVVALGGPAALSTTLVKRNATKSQAPRDIQFEVFKEPVNQNEHGHPIDGQLTPDSLSTLCKFLLPRTEPLLSENDSLRKTFMEQARMSANIDSTHSGTHLKVDTGIRQLPLAYQVAWKATLGKSEVVCDIVVSTIGKGDVVGTFHATFDTEEALTQGNIERQDSFVARIWRYCENQERIKKDQGAWPPMETAKQIASEVWRLERETWKEE